MSYLFRSFLFVFSVFMFSCVYIIYPGDLGEFLLLLATFVFVCGYLLLQVNINFFEPFYLFSWFYLTFIFSAMALRVGGFENNLFIAETYFYNDLDDLFFLCGFYVFVGYVSAFAGYRLFSTNKVVSIVAVSVDKNHSSLKFISYILFFIGVVNFSYNVISLYSGSLIEYYKNVSMRFYDFESGGTTIGYHLIYVSVYVLFLMDLDKKKLSIVTGALVFFAVAIFASQGRIFETLVFVMSFVVLYYYNMGAARLNFQVVFFGFIVFFLGVIFYILRYASSLNYNNALASYGGLIPFLLESLTLDSLLGFSVGMGNVPNFAVLMKVVDSWSWDIGYMFGGTLLYPLAEAFFMSSVFNDFIGMPAVLAKNQWYAHLPLGNLPVTGIGEMYLNFGFFGPVLGMFFFGSLGAFVYNFAVRLGSNIFLIFYAKFAVGFFMLYPKGEFNNFGLFWMAIHPLIIYFLIKFLDRLQAVFAGRSVVRARAVQ